MQAELMQTAPTQPNHGASCNGCGACCLAEPCGLSTAFFSVRISPYRCLALEYVDGRYLCGLVSNTAEYARRVGISWPESDYAKLGEDVFGVLLGIGMGCDTSVESREERN